MASRKTTIITILPIASLHKSPVRVNLHTEHTIEAIRSSLEEGRAAPGITAAAVGKSFYIVDGHARVEAYQRAEVEEINVAEVLYLESETDVLIEHVKRNVHSPMNPIRVAAAALLLQKSGVQDPFKVLGISPVMETAVNVLVSWPGDVVSRLSRVLDMKASRFSDVHALPHFFTAFEALTDKVRRGDRGAEEELRGTVLYIVQYLESVSSETEFTLPGPDQIYALMRGRKQRMITTPTTTTTTTAAAAGAVESAQQESRRSPAESVTAATKAGYERGDSGYKAPALMPDKNKSVIRCTHCDRPQVVDLKTGHVCPVETVADGTIEVIRDGDGHRAYVLGAKAMKMLGLDRSADEISPSRYSVIATDRKSEVERVLRSAKPTARYVVIISNPEGRGG